MLLADDAVDAAGIRQAAVAVEVGPADDRGVLCRPVQAADGAGGADLTAQGAVVLAVADAADQPRREQPFQAGLEAAGVQGVADADLHAFAAAYALAEKIHLGKRPGRADKEWLGSAGVRSGGQGERRQGTGGERSQHGPPAQVDRRCGRGRVGRGEVDAVARALMQTVEAEHALGRVDAPVQVNGPGAADGAAQAAGAAVVVTADQPHQRPTAAQGEQAAERAEGAAEVAALHPAQAEDHEQQDERGHGQGVDLGRKGQHVGAQEGVNRFGELVHPDGSVLVGPGEQGGEGVVQRRVHGQGECAHEDREGVEVAGQGQAEQGAGEQEQEQRVFQPPAARLRVAAGSAEQHPARVDERAHGTDPAAERPAEDEGERHRGQRRQHEHHHGFRREHGGERQQRIDAEEQVDRAVQFVHAAVIGLDEQHQEENKKAPLCQPAPAHRAGQPPAGGHQAPTTRMRAKSISPRPMRWAATVEVTSSGRRSKRVVAQASAATGSAEATRVSSRRTSATSPP